MNEILIKLAVVGAMDAVAYIIKLLEKDGPVTLQELTELREKIKPYATYDPTLGAS